MQKALAITTTSILQSRADLRERSPEFAIREDSKELPPVNGASLLQQWWKENN